MFSKATWSLYGNLRFSFSIIVSSSFSILGKDFIVLFTSAGTLTKLPLTLIWPTLGIPISCMKASLGDTSLSSRFISSSSFGLVRKDKPFLTQSFGTFPFLTDFKHALHIHSFPSSSRYQPRNLTNEALSFKLFVSQTDCLKKV